MTYTIVPYTTRPEWLALRRTGIGASDIAAIMGVSPWSTPRQVWVSKVDEDAPEVEPSEDMEWGLKMERLVVDGASDRESLSVLHRNPFCRNNDSGWLVATPDAIAEDPDGFDVLIEAKKVDDWNWDTIPTHYTYQVQWQLAVTGYPTCVLAVLHRGRRLELYPIERDEEVIAELVSAGERFWGLCENGTPPPVEASDSGFLGDLWPDSVEEAVEVPVGLAVELRAAKSMVARAEADLDLVVARVKELLGEADTAVCGQDVVATWKTGRKTRIDAGMLKAEAPEIYESYLVNDCRKAGCKIEGRHGHQRRFLVKEER